MKTIVGRVVVAGVVAGAAGFGAGCEHPQIPTAKSSDKATTRRIRTIFSERWGLNTVEIWVLSEFASIHERYTTAIYATKNTSDETQIPMDDVQELSKLDALLSQRSRERYRVCHRAECAAEPDSAY
jgi:hypothetical protein